MTQNNLYQPITMYKQYNKQQLFYLNGVRHSWWLRSRYTNENIWVKSNNRMNRLSWTGRRKSDKLNIVRYNLFEYNADNRRWNVSIPTHCWVSAVVFARTTVIYSTCFYMCLYNIIYLQPIKCRPSKLYRNTFINYTYCTSARIIKWTQYNIYKDINSGTIHRSYCI